MSYCLLQNFVLEVVDVPTCTALQWGAKFAAMYYTNQPHVVIGPGKISFRLYVSFSILVFYFLFLLILCRLFVLFWCSIFSHMLANVLFCIEFLIYKYFAGLFFQFISLCLSEIENMKSIIFQLQNIIPQLWCFHKVQKGLG